ncbi:hypothetical protein MX009_05590 [Streptococcus uberis]|nr:hypothetical protein [Streptococcus uberis]MCK1193176.1 hypothetical protein [Streptococcus uberis]MCK1198378.1 hypothetical protein [Streptococcus uberis]MCK1200900.1 hypothetical protein [Streptococcus uberis]MCK1229859.1 hypothetical protein [Streptococcus uberis]MCK1253581.1 hypothetical protein [Streptococcus uberis]
MTYHLLSFYGLGVDSLGVSVAGTVGGVLGASGLGAGVLGVAGWTGSPTL